MSLSKPHNNELTLQFCLFIHMSCRIYAQYSIFVALPEISLIVWVRLGLHEVAAASYEASMTAQTGRLGKGEVLPKQQNNWKYGAVATATFSSF